MKQTATRRPRLHARQAERGFALLLVFLMASAVALMLYMQLPRQAFESERDKEQLLIDRGEQYKRAIYVYYISNNHQWPSKIDDLESTNGHRYLRHRYVDPYTGKDEWRLIHTNGAFLTDSLVTPPPAQGSPGVQGGALAGTGAPTGGTGFTLTSPATTSGSTPGATDPNAPPAVNAQVARRPSDQALVQNSGYQNIPGGVATPNNSNSGYQPFNPASLPPITLYPNGYNAPAANAPGTVGGNPGTNQPGLNQPGGVNQLGGVNQAGGINQPGFQQPNFGQGGINQGVLNQGGQSVVNLPGTNFAVTNPGIPLPDPNGFNQQGFNQTGVNQAPVSSQTNLNQFGLNTSGSLQTGAVPAPNSPFSAGQQFPTAGGPPGGGGIPPGGSNQAANLINQLLTQPRQPPAGIGQNQPQSGGGGLAGVASTYKGTTIKSYGERTKYQEWEFVFQLNQQGTGIQTQPGQGPNGSGGIPSGSPGAPGTSGANGAAAFPGTSSTGAGGTAGSSGFGTSGFGTSGFGSSGFGTSNSSSPFGSTSH